MEHKPHQWYPKFVPHPTTGKPTLCADHLAHGRLIGRTVRPDTTIEEEPEPYDLSKAAGGKEPEGGQKLTYPCGCSVVGSGPDPLPDCCPHHGKAEAAEKPKGPYVATYRVVKGPATPEDKAKSDAVVADIDAGRATLKVRAAKLEPAVPDEAFDEPFDMAALATLRKLPGGGEGKPSDEHKNDPAKTE